MRKRTRAKDRGENVSRLFPSLHSSPPSSTARGSAPPASVEPCASGRRSSASSAVGPPPARSSRDGAPRVASAVHPHPRKVLGPRLRLQQDLDTGTLRDSQRRSGTAFPPIMEAEPGFDANDDVWRCAAPCFFELFRGQCDGCGKIYDLTPEMEEHDQEVSLRSSVQRRDCPALFFFFARAPFRRRLQTL